MYRTITLAALPTDQPKPTPPAAAVFLFENELSLPAGYARLDEAVGGEIARAIHRPEFKAAKASVLTLYPEHGPGRLFVVGLGSREKFNAEVLRAGVARLLRRSLAAKLESLELRVTDGIGDRASAEQAGQAIGDGLAAAGFAFDAFKGKATRETSEEPAIDLAVDVDEALRPHVEAALTVGRGAARARKLAATPPNVANPAYIEAHCREMADEVGLTCEVIDVGQAEELGMGGLTAVGRGGSEPPRLIVLKWEPNGTAAQQPLMLVGKAITFDTGGVSLKPSASMAGMKYDKCGGMAVIGAMDAIARLNVQRRVVGLIPCAENLIDETAYRVDDILTFCNGVTSEITNTDAEGRLVLADALAYGTKTYQPAAVIDLATLTGGVVVALGGFCAGLFCNDDSLRQKLADAATFTGERTWELPLWDEHREMMKGTHADLVNSGERKAHPIQGAAFLSFFVGEEAPKKMPTIPWAHLDIAGVATVEKDTDLYDKGPTGWGVRLLARLVATWG